MNNDFPTAAVGSSQAPTTTVEKSSRASNTKIQTAPAQDVGVIVNPALASEVIAKRRRSANKRFVLYDEHKFFVKNRDINPSRLTIRTEIGDVARAVRSLSLVDWLTHVV